MKKDDYFAPCAICGKPVYKPMFDVWPWKCFARNSKKTLWFCSEKCFLQWKKDKDIDTLGRNYGRKRIPCKDGVETVRQIRIRKGIPAKAISSMLGVGTSTYCHLEKGAQAWHKEWLPAIAKVLGESVDYIKWQSISVSKGPEEVLEFHPEGLPEDPDDSDSSDDAPKKRKPYHEHYYITKIDTGRKTLVEVLEEKDVVQKELAFKLGIKLMKFRACLYGHNAWPRSIVDKICKILEIKVEDVKWERINEGK